MRDQHQRNVQFVVMQQLFLLFARPLIFKLHRGSDALHRTQHPLDHLLEVGFALTQVLVFHLVELARDHLVLRCQGPLGVVMPLRNPTLDATDELLVLQKHEVNIQQGGEFMRRVRRQVALQARDLFDHGIARITNPLNL